MVSMIHQSEEWKKLFNEKSFKLRNHMEDQEEVYVKAKRELEVYQLKLTKFMPSIQDL